MFDVLIFLSVTELAASIFLLENTDSVHGTTDEQI